MRATVISALLLLLPAAAAAQFKCTGADGRIAFQQAPCAAGAASEPLKLRDREPPEGAGFDISTAEGIRRQRLYAERYARAEARRADVDGAAAVGRPLSDVAGLFGKLLAENAYAGPGGAQTQRVYERGFRHFYVYTRADGVVTAVQSAPVVIAR